MVQESATKGGEVVSEATEVVTKGERWRRSNRRSREGEQANSRGEKA